LRAFIVASAGKVLIIVQNLPVPFDRRVWLESMTLSKAGYQVTVISPTGKKDKYSKYHEVLDGIHIYRYPAPPEAQGISGYILEFAYCWLMTALISLWVAFRHGFDIIHACNPPETYFLLACFYKLFGKKFIFDHHDLSPEMYLAKGQSTKGLLFQGLLLLEWLTFKSADTVIATNHSHAEIAHKRGGVAKDDIFIVRSGPDFQRLKSLPPEAILKRGFKHLVCYLGEMCEQDGVEYLLWVAKIIHEQFQRQDVGFVLMGGGPDLERLQQRAHEMALESYVHFTGRVSDHDLCRYLSTADVCVDPDPLTEWSDKSTMNKIMEYMAFRRPIVAFDLKENRFSAQEAAVYASPNDAYEMASMVAALLDNECQREKMGAYGRERVQQYLSWPNSEAHLLAAYQHVLSR
jgi:glycosyltransferase involved in cell wall biosynthesis